MRGSLASRTNLFDAGDSSGYTITESFWSRVPAAVIALPAMLGLEAPRVEPVLVGSHLS